jgi:hypothetical protein
MNIVLHTRPVKLTVENYAGAEDVGAYLAYKCKATGLLRLDRIVGTHPRHSLLRKETSRENKKLLPTVYRDQLEIDISKEEIVGVCTGFGCYDYITIDEESKMSLSLYY